MVRRFPGTRILAALPVVVAGWLAPAAALAQGGTPAPRAGGPAPARPAASASARPPGLAVLPFLPRLHRLKNGLRVVLVKRATPGLAAYYTLVRTGSRNEVEPGHSGFAHFFEHMMFRGTERASAAQRNAILKQLGVDSNAFTSDNMTVYTYYGPSRALPTLVELEADRFQRLKFSEHDFKTEAKAVLGEYNKSFSNPVRKMEEVLLDNAFQKHTYKHTTIGFLEDIKQMPMRYAYSLKFFQRYYRPDNCTLFVVGDFDEEATLALIEKHYAGWKGRAAEPRIAREPAQRAERKATLDWPQATLPRLMVGYHTPSLGTGGRAGLRAAAIQNVLGPLLFGKSSALHRELVLEKQIVEGLEPQYGDHRDPHLFYFLVTVKDEAKLGEVQGRIDAALEALAKGQLDPAELEAVKSNLRYGLLMQLETPAQIAEALAVSTSATGDPLTLDRLYTEIAQLTPKDVVAFARRYLRPQNRTVVVLRPAPRRAGAATPAGAARGGAQ